MSWESFLLSCIWRLIEAVTISSVHMLILFHGIHVNLWFVLLPITMSTLVKLLHFCSCQFYFFKPQSKKEEKLSIRGNLTLRYFAQGLQKTLLLFYKVAPKNETFRSLWNYHLVSSLSHRIFDVMLWTTLCTGLSVTALFEMLGIFTITGN